MPEPFAGARWWKFDFHTHTPASLDTPWSGIENEKERLSPEQWLLRFMEAQIDCVAVTDHNTSDWIDRLKNAYSQLVADQPTGFRPLCVFPGVELSVNGGFHLLAVFDRGATGRDVSDLIARVEYQGTPGRCDGVTRKSATEVVELVADLGALAIPAHVDQENGLLQTAGDTGQLALDANTVGQVIRRPEILAAEVVNRDWVEHQICRDAGCAWTAVVGSDCHSFRRGVKPGDRFTWVKMGQPSMEGLRLALLDGAPLSVHRSDREGGDPNELPRLAIEALRVGNARRAGRGEALQVGFSPWMSVIVGGRGTGKSTLVEMLRLALDRAGELPARLRNDFEQFARVAASRDDQGALLDDTTIGVVYRKDRARFRINWRAGDASIEERSGADDWSSSPGDVQGRFPVRILSQKQIFALAADPDALVRLVDDALPAEDAEHERRRRQMETRYLSLRGQIRELEARLADRSRVEGELADVKRQLAAFEEGGQQALLVEFQRFRRQERAIRNRREEMDDAVKRLRGAAAEIEPTDVREEEFPTKSAAAAEMLGLVRALADKQSEMARRLMEMADEAAGFLEQWRAGANASEWMTAASANRGAYDALVARLAKEGVADPTSYGGLVQRRHALEREIRDIETLRTRVEQLQVQSAGVLGDLENDRVEMSRVRMAFLEGVLAGNRFVAMAVIPFGREARAAEPAFRQRVGRQDEHLQQDILAADGDSGILADLYSNLPADFDARAAAVRERVAAVKRDVATIAAGGSVEGRTKWFHNHLQSLPPEQVDRFMCWWPEDGLRVQYRRSDAGQLVPIEQGSPGQKSAAILAFLLCHGDEPIVLDQPEDDLDNHLIYDLVVQQVRAGKQRRQVIVATHNPNIVVNGDAEMVIAMDHRAGQCRMLDQGSGCLQEPGVREEICRVMEGGRQAFERRYRRLLENARHA